MLVLGRGWGCCFGGWVWIPGFGEGPGWLPWGTGRCFRAFGRVQSYPSDCKLARGTVVTAAARVGGPARRIAVNCHTFQQMSERHLVFV